MKHQNQNNVSKDREPNPKPSGFEAEMETNIKMARLKVVFILQNMSFMRTGSFWALLLAKVTKREVSFQFSELTYKSLDSRTAHKLVRCCDSGHT
jgi:hypothetical protein